MVDRPKGVTILGVLVIVAAIVTFLIGLAGVFVGLAEKLPGVDIATGNLIGWGALYIILGVVLFIAGAGLLRLRMWAWWLALVSTLAALAYAAYHVYQVGMSGSVVTLIISAIILAYLVMVRRHFKRPVAPQAPGPTPKTT